MKSYSGYVLILIAVLQTILAKAQTGDIKFITAIRFVTDYKKDGVRGINITCRYNGLAVEGISHNDYILKRHLLSFNNTFYK